MIVAAKIAGHFYTSDKETYRPFVVKDFLKFPPPGAGAM